MPNLPDFDMSQQERNDNSEPAFDTNSTSRLLTVPKAAAYLGVSQYSLRKMVRQGQLPTRQVASRKMIPSSLLREWLGPADRTDALVTHREKSIV
jgi:excisionase family DNA binding protein